LIVDREKSTATELVGRMREVPCVGRRARIEVKPKTASRSTGEMTVVMRDKSEKDGEEMEGGRGATLQG
jgi:hypothetical protein